MEGLLAVVKNFNDGIVWRDDVLVGDDAADARRCFRRYDPRHVPAEARPQPLFSSAMNSVYLPGDSRTRKYFPEGSLHMSPRIISTTPERESQMISFYF